MGEFELYKDGDCYAYWKDENGICFMQSEYDTEPTRLTAEEYAEAYKEYCRN